MAMTSDRRQERRQRSPSCAHKWGWFVALGVLMLIAGAIAMANLFRRPSCRCSTSAR